jgi:signal transduction histidine kinase
VSVRDEAEVRPFGEIAAEIGHELNNHLGIVSGRAELARMHLDRGRLDDVRAGVDVILRQMDRMRLISERLRGMRQPPLPLALVDLVESVDAALRAHPLPGEDAASRRAARVPAVRAHRDTIADCFASIRAHVLDAASPDGSLATTRVEVLHEPGAKAAGITITIEGLAPEPLRRLLADVTRLVAPTGLGLRADFTETGALLALEFPTAEVLSGS